MRKFSSYGAINTKLHYYAPREGLIKQAYTQLLGDDPDEGGHYAIAWGRGKRARPGSCSRRYSGCSRTNGSTWSR